MEKELENKLPHNSEDLRHQAFHLIYLQVPGHFESLTS